MKKKIETMNIIKSIQNRIYEIRGERVMLDFSEKAINMNIVIMRAFVEVRRVFLQQKDMKEQLKQIKERLGEHDV